MEFGKVVINDKDVLEELNKGGSGSSGSIAEASSSHVKFQLAFREDGTPYTKLLPLAETGLIPTDIPSDYPMYEVEGESVYEGDFYIAPGTSTAVPTYVSIISPKGELLFYHKTKSQPYHFRKMQNSQGKNRYMYSETIPGYPKINNHNGYQNCELVILDENFVEMDRVRMVDEEPFANFVPEGFTDPNGDNRYPIDSHGVLYIDDYHYLIYCYYTAPEDNNFKQYFQEVKNGKIIWSWNTTSLADVGITQSGQDPHHVNDIFLDSNGDLYMSALYIGLIKLNRKTNTVEWVLSRNQDYNTFSGVMQEDGTVRAFVDNDTTNTQHCVKWYPYDNSFITYDNGGSDKTRACRYWIDESTNSVKFKEYKFADIPSKSIWGSANVIDSDNEILDISLSNGNTSSIAFVEHDFKTDTRLMTFTFTGIKKNVYQVWRDFDYKKIPKKIK